ncbi:MAG: hypothetical protein WAR22_06195, partial [Desulfomonilia bacterium]
GNRISGMIKITDTGKLDDQGNPLVTEITGVNGDLSVTQYRTRWDEENSRVVMVENSMISDRVDGRTTQYEPREGARFVDLGSGQAISNSRDLNPLEQQVLYFFGQQGDHAIDIEFMGSDRSRIDVTGTGAADILLNDRIVNRNGDVSISSGQGSILSLNESARISGTNITLSASEGEVGKASQAIQIDTKSGVLRAEAEGLINIAEAEGDLVIESLNTRGDALITADGSITDLQCAHASIIAKDITLVSENGGIGTADNDLTLDSLDGALTARAKDGIYLTETSGTMRVNRVASADGDVALIADGSIEDYNFPEADGDTLEQLADAKNDLNLGSEAKVQEAIAAYKQQKKTEYQAEHRISDNGTPFEPNDDTYDSTYDPDWEYVLTQDEELAFAESVWRDEDLINAKNILTLPGDITADEEANVSGRNITLISNANIGSYGGTVIIDKADIASGNVTPEERTLLVRAEKGEAVYDEQGNVVISLDKDFDIQASGRIDIQADGYVFLDAVHTGSHGPLQLSVGGRSGLMADSVDITAASEHSILFDTLFAREALVDATGSLGFQRTLIGQGALLTDQRYSVIVDNACKTLHDADLQLYAKDLTFYLFFPGQDRTFRTNAHVVKYQDDVIVDRFSSENSITRLVPKLLSDTDSEEEQEDGELAAVRARASWLSPSTAGPVAFDPGKLGIEGRDFIADENDGTIEWE